MIEFNDDIRCVWFCSADSFDLLGALSRNKEGYSTLIYRFARYEPGHEKTDAFKDEAHTKKNWDGYRSQDTSDSSFQMLHDRFDSIIALMSSTYRVPKFRLWRPLDESIDDFMVRFVALPFVHGKWKKK